MAVSACETTQGLIPNQYKEAESHNIDIHGDPQ